VSHVYVIAHFIPTDLMDSGKSGMSTLNVLGECEKIEEVVLNRD